MEQWQYWTGSVPLDFSHCGLETTISTFAFLPLWNEGVCINDPTSRLPLYVDYVRGRWWGFFTSSKNWWMDWYPGFVTRIQDQRSHIHTGTWFRWWDLSLGCWNETWRSWGKRWVSFVNRCPDVTNHASHTSSINIAPIHINVLDFSS